MINLDENFFNIVSDTLNIIFNNSFLSFCLYFSFFSFCIIQLCKLFLKGSINFSDDENITYSDEYEVDSNMNDDDRFNYGFFKK